MRNLTLTRKKSYVGCLVADQVYVRDAVAAEVTIQGVPCRKIGTLKNGETKTFQIEDGEQRIFLIADKVSKNYCNAALTIPEGQEDVAYTGKHVFSLGSNAFEFEGVELSEADKAIRKRNKRKGAVIYFAAIAVGLVIGFVVNSGILNKPAKDKTFTKDDFSITLTEDFKEDQRDEAYVSYQSNDVLIYVLREDYSYFDDITLEEYVELGLLANDQEGLEVYTGEGYLWCSYTDETDGEKYYNVVAFYEGKDAFWAIEFTTFKNKAKEYDSQFKQWAASVEVGKPSSADVI